MQGKRPFLLSPGTGGVDRFDRSGRSTKLIEGYDVIADDGELRRRDAFRGVAAAPGFALPANRTSIFYGSDPTGASGTVPSSRIVDGSDGSYFFIGCDIPFDGIRWPIAATSYASAGTPDQNLRLAAHYWSGAAWTSVPWLLDTTRSKLTGAANYAEPFMKDGRIHFHRSQLTGWAASTLQSLSRYWIRLTVVNGAGTVSTCDGAVSVASPGVHVFLQAPVNMLAPVTIGGRHHLLIGSDRHRRRGLEGGASLADWHLGERGARPLELTRYRSTGVFGSVTFPQWQRNGSAVGSAGTEGSANVLTNHPRAVSNFADPVEDFSFLENNPVDAIVASGITPAGGSTTTSFTTATIVGKADNDYEHYILVVTTAGNLALGDYRIVSGFTGGASTSTFVTRAWSAAPNTSVRFRLIRPSKRFRFYGERTRALNAADFRRHSIPPVPTDTVSVGARTVTLNSADPDDHTSAMVDNTAMPVHFQMTEQLRWGIGAGRRWSYVYDTITRRTILTNGESGLLQYDGEQLTTLDADVQSALAQYLAGKIADEQELISGADPTLLARSQFRVSPPKGKYLVLYRSMLVVAGNTDRPFSVYNSLAGGANNIWPLSNETQVRDQRGETITGLASLYERLYAFTKSSIHEGVLNDDGSLSFNPISQGVGFTSHHAVIQVPWNGGLSLVGVSGDGIYATNGQEPVPVLDNWDRLVPGGVNIRRLDQAVGAIFRTSNLAVFAVASRGSQVNDLLLVWDYSVGSWWVWRHPVGVSALAPMVVNGKEVLAIGCEDGIVQFLWDAPDDDGTEIEGDALSAPEQPMGPVELAFSRLNLTMRSMGTTQTIDAALYVNERDVSAEGTVVSYPLTEAQATFGTAVMGSAVWADERYKSFGVMIPAPARGTIVQYRVRGSARWRLRMASVEGEGKSSSGQP